MFEDLIVDKEVPGDLFDDIEEELDKYGAMSQEDRFMYDLLSDVEEVVDELWHQGLKHREPCIWCGKKEGEAHDSNCFYITTMKRLIAEIDTLSNKTPI